MEYYMEINKLIIPTKEMVQKYVSYWEKPNENNASTYDIQLFNDGENVNVREYWGKRYCRNFNKDELIKKRWQEGKVKEFLRLINSTYSTRVSNLDKVELENVRLEGMSMSSFIACVKKESKRKEYSFATKVFNFIHPTEYPIIDSLSVTLLWLYLSEKLNRAELMDYSRNNWGSYRSYKEAYDKFIDIYQLNDLSYKEIDIFLWTYGVVLKKYCNEKYGVFKLYNVPSYKDEEL